MLLLAQPSNITRPNNDKIFEMEYSQSNNSRLTGAEMMFILPLKWHTEFGDLPSKVDQNKQHTHTPEFLEWFSFSSALPLNINNTCE